MLLIAFFGFVVLFVCTISQKKSGASEDNNNNKDSIEYKFYQYIQVVAKKGFFNGTQPGTPGKSLYNYI